MVAGDSNMSKYSDDIKEIKSDIKEILKLTYTQEEHLRTLNGKVARHDKSLFDDCPKRHDKINDSINSIKTKIAYYGGGLAAVLVLLEFTINYIK